jgi:hypothetical protein
LRAQIYENRLGCGLFIESVGPERKPDLGVPGKAVGRAAAVIEEIFELIGIIQGDARIPHEVGVKAPFVQHGRANRDDLPVDRLRNEIHVMESVLVAPRLPEPEYRDHDHGRDSN